MLMSSQLSSHTRFGVMMTREYSFPRAGDWLLPAPASLPRDSTKANAVAVVRSMEPLRSRSFSLAKYLERSGHVVHVSARMGERSLSYYHSSVQYALFQVVRLVRRTTQAHDVSTRTPWQRRRG